jgi:hypothetical protein
MNIDIIPQVGVAITGTIAIWLAMGRLPKWAPIFGLAGQPFWFWASVSHKQWGIVALSVVYTLGWARGIHTHWMKS